MGNDRISKETIILFSNVQLNENVNNDKLDQILKIYMKPIILKIPVKFDDELFINVESPIIDRVVYPE